jgi:hypothetical protein
MLKSCLEPTILGYVAAELNFFFFFLEYHFEIVSPRHDEIVNQDTICALKIVS